MQEIKKQCLVCRNAFTVCRKNDMNNWRNVVCCPEHFYFHLPVIGYVRKEITKSQAKKELSEAIERFGEPDWNNNIRPVINEIFGRTGKENNSHGKEN